MGSWQYVSSSLREAGYTQMCLKDFDHKILTSARNGELIMWDLNKSGPTKYGERSRRTRLS